MLENWLRKKTKQHTNLLALMQNKEAKINIQCIFIVLRCHTNNFVSLHLHTLHKIHCKYRSTMEDLCNIYVYMCRFIRLHQAVSHLIYFTKMKIKMKSNFDEIYVGNSSYLSSLYINRAGNRIFRKNLNFTRKKCFPLSHPSGKTVLLERCLNESLIKILV